MSLSLLSLLEALCESPTRGAERSGAGHADRNTVLILNVLSGRNTVHLAALSRVAGRAHMCEYRLLVAVERRRLTLALDARDELKSSGDQGTQALAEQDVLDRKAGLADALECHGEGVEVRARLLSTLSICPSPVCYRPSPVSVPFPVPCPFSSVPHPLIRFRRCP